MTAQTSSFAHSFAKNWLYQLAGSQPVSKLELSAVPSLWRWSLRCCGGFLLWLVLILPAQAVVELRVAISQGDDAVSIGTSTPGIIRNGSGQALYQLPELQGITVEADANEVDLTNDGQTLAESNAFWLEPSANGFVWIDGKWYRGRVKVTLADGELTAINYVDLEDYLYSVVGSEMPTSWPQQALRSQAVAARSYALYRRARARNPMFDVDATTTYQVYKGLAQEHPNTLAAVDATEGEVVTHNGQVIEAIFHSSSGGHTENAGEVWSSDVPYLRGVQDFDQDAPVYSWQEVFSLAEFSDKVADIGRIHTIGVPQLTTQGRVSSIRLAGEGGSQTLRGRDIRSALRLRSTRFTLDLDENNGRVTVNGFGFGHGVGMSQWGARSLAEQGWSYDQILQHYYQSTVVAQLEN